MARRVIAVGACPECLTPVAGDPPSAIGPAWVVETVTVAQVAPRLPAAEASIDASRQASATTAGTVLFLSLSPVRVGLYAAVYTIGSPSVRWSGRVTAPR